MAADGEFFKYPRTPHVEGSKVVDDDKSVSWKSIDKAAKALGKSADTVGAVRYVVQEKVDGANVGVHFGAEWNPVIQKRGGLVGRGEHAQYNVFRDWVYEHMEGLYSVLGTQYVLFGEWMWAQHGVAYDALESFFVAFDVLDKSSGKFLSTPAMTALLDPLVQDAVFPVVPLLANEDAGATKVKALVQGLGTRVSAYGTEEAEGVYIRMEDDAHVLDRFKMRRDTFTAGRSDFATNVVNNTLRS